MTKSSLCFIAKSSLRSIAFGCAAIFTAISASAQNAPPPATSTTAQPSAVQTQMDKTFVHKASEGGYTEVQFGQLAAQKATNPDVKAFGEKMVQDHTMLNDKMKLFVDQFGLMAPTQLNKEDQTSYDRLKAISGLAFDMAYVSAMVSDHRKDLQEFRNEEMNTTDPQLKIVVADGEKVIQEHLDMINHIAKEVGVSVPPPMSPSKTTPPAPAQ